MTTLRERIDRRTVQRLSVARIDSRRRIDRKVISMLFDSDSALAATTRRTSAAHSAPASRFAAVGLLAVVAFATVLLAAGSASALAIYTYTGNPYDSIRNSGGIGGTYDTSQSVQGSFTIAQALGANLFNADISTGVLSFSFDDGRQTFDENSPLSRAFFAISTDAAGQITAWRVVLEQRNVVNALDAIDTVNFGATTRDRGRQVNSPVIRDEGVANNNPGIWEVTVVIPEPGTAILLGLGLVGLGSRRSASVA